MESAAPLVKKLNSSWQDVSAWLTSTEFYLEMLSIAVAITVAWLLAIIIRRRVRYHLKKSSSLTLDFDLYQKPLRLLASLLSIVLLSALLPIARKHEAGLFIDAFIQLCTAWFCAKAILIYVRSRFVAYLIALVIMMITLLSVTGFLGSITEYLSAINFEIGNFKLSMFSILKGLVMLVVVFWLAGAVSRTLETYLRRATSMNYNTRELIVKFFNIFIYFIAFIITLSAIGVDLTAFAVFGGALGVGIGLGLQKITSNFISGITLLMEKSIKIGDLIEVGDVTGLVRQLNIRYALLETPDGREVLIPNEELFTSRVINWTYSNSKARVDISVGVSYDSDHALVKKLLLDAAKQHPLCLKDPAPNCFMREFADSSVKFLLVFWVPDVKDGRYGPQSDVMYTILESFKTHGIVIPYPHQVHIEGKTK